MNFINKYSKTNIGYDTILEISKILGSQHDIEANSNMYISANTCISFFIVYKLIFSNKWYQFVVEKFKKTIVIYCNASYDTKYGYKGTRFTLRKYKYNMYFLLH